MTFSPTSTGAKTAVINIASDDADENPFEIQLSGSGTVAEIAVYEGLGTSGTARMNNIGVTSFGAVVVGASSAPQSFTLENAGSGSLTLGGITLGGVNSDQFTLNLAGLDTSLAAGETTSFSVAFSPSATGLKSAVIQIASDDADENPFLINISGAGLAGAEIAVTDQVLTAADGLEGGGSLYRPMPGVINQLGEVSFHAYGKVGTGGILPSDDVLLLTDASGGLRVIARESMSLEAGTASVLLGLQSALNLNDLGHTVFYDRIAGSTVLQDQGYFLSENGVDLEGLTRTGDSMPGGGKLKPVATTLVADADGRWYFSNGLSGAGVTTKTDTGIWQEEAGTLSLLAREGSDLSALTGDPAWLGNVSTKLSGAGDGVAFIAGLQNHPTITTQRTNSLRNEVVLDGNEQGLEVIVRKGDVAPDTGGQTLLALQGVARSATGAHAVQARLKTSTSVTTSNDMILLSIAGGTSRLVAREGVTLIEGIPVRSFRAFYAVGEDEVIFLTDRALCRWTQAAGIHVLACIGSPAPAVGSNYRLMNRLSVSEGGAIALQTTHNSGRAALWRALPGGSLTCVLCTGDATTVNAAPATIYALGIHADGTGAGGGGGGRGAGINDAGTILATLSVGGGVHVARKLQP